MSDILTKDNLFINSYSSSCPDTKKTQKTALKAALKADLLKEIESNKKISYIYPLVVLLLFIFLFLLLIYYNYKINKNG